MQEFYIGTCQFQLKSLVFGQAAGLSKARSRGRKPSAINRLRPIFKRGIKHAERRNHIAAYVSPSHLHQILAASAVSLHQLSQSQAPYPKLLATTGVKCLHGRQRYETAKSLHGLDYWWTIRLFCLPDGADPPRVLNDEVHLSLHQTPLSDGDIVANLHEDRARGLCDVDDELRFDLSECKKKALKRLEKWGSIFEVFKSFLEFPGLWDGVELGNFDKHRSLRVPNLIQTHFHLIREIWSFITLEDPEVMAATDVETVTGLESRAPSVSEEDREDIKHMMRSGTAWRDITDPIKRQKIEDRLMQLRGVIHTIKTFHENMKYVSVGVLIIKDHILGRRFGEDETLFDAVTALWSSPAHCLVECSIEEDRWAIAPSTPQLAFLVLFVSAIRDFALLSRFRPLYDREPRLDVDGACLGRFLRRAQSLGYNSPHIERKLREIEYESLTRTEELRRTASTGEGLPTASCIGDLRAQVESKRRRRCGRPHTQSYDTIRQHLFLPQLMGDFEVQAFPPILFIQKDFITSFFGPLPVLSLSNVVERSGGLAGWSPPAADSSLPRGTHAEPRPSAFSTSPVDPPLNPQLSEASQAPAQPLTERPENSDISPEIPAVEEVQVGQNELTVFPWNRDSEDRSVQWEPIEDRDVGRPLTPPLPGRIWSRLSDERSIQQPEPQLPQQSAITLEQATHTPTGQQSDDSTLDPELASLEEHSLMRRRIWSRQSDVRSILLPPVPDGRPSPRLEQHLQPNEPSVAQEQIAGTIPQHSPHTVLDALWSRYSEDRSVLSLASIVGAGDAVRPCSPNHGVHNSPVRQPMNPFYLDQAGSQLMSAAAWAVEHRRRPHREQSDSEQRSSTAPSLTYSPSLSDRSSGLTGLFNIRSLPRYLDDQYSNLSEQGDNV